MTTHFFGDTAVLLGRSLRHITRSLDTIITTTIMPIAFMLLFVYVFGGAINSGSDSYVNYLLPGILLITIASGISYTAFRLFLDMKSGIFERFQSMPIARSSVLWAHVLTSLVANLISLVVVVLVALLMGFRSGAGVLAWLAVAGILILFTLALTWIAVIPGLTAKSADGASAFSYPLIFLPFISSAFVPTDTMPGPVRAFAENQPVTSIVNAIRDLFTQQPVGTDIWIALAWCVGILVVAYVFAMVTYRRRIALGSCLLRPISQRFRWRGATTSPRCGRSDRRRGHHRGRSRRFRLNGQQTEPADGRPGSSAAKAWPAGIAPPRSRRTGTVSGRRPRAGLPAGREAPRRKCRTTRARGHAVGGDLEDGEVGVDAADAADAGQRVGAARDELRARRPWRRASSSRRRRLAPIARSIAPPTAGMASGAPVCQLARSPLAETWKAPSTQTSRWPPRIIAKESAWWKYDGAGQLGHRHLAGVGQVGVDLVADGGAGPCRACRSRCAGRRRSSAGRWSATMVGWPMPRLT